MPTRGLMHPAMAIIALSLTLPGCSIFRGGETDPATPATEPGTSPTESPSGQQTSPEPPARASSEESVDGEEVSVVLTPEERDRLVEAARMDLDRVNELAREIDEDGMSPESVDRLRAMERLVDSAEEALTGDDPVAAASLARKAKLLAEELVKD